jgi:uncharacterized cupin superfamily protein
METHGPMRIVNTESVEWQSRRSPRGRFARDERMLSEALGRDRRSTDLLERHPFDVDITRVPPGTASCPYHSHSAQWEFFHVIYGSGTVRHAGGREAIGAGDAFVFKPGEPHQLINDGTDDLVVYVIADNPVGDSCYYPDSNKFAVKSPEYTILRSDPLDHFDGEE